MMLKLMPIPHVLQMNEIFPTSRTTDSGRRLLTRDPGGGGDGRQVMVPPPPGGGGGCKGISTPHKANTCAPSVREWYHTRSPGENILGLEKGHDTLTPCTPPLERDYHRIHKGD